VEDGVKGGPERDLEEGWDIFDQGISESGVSQYLLIFGLLYTRLDPSAWITIPSFFYFYLVVPAGE